MEKREQILVAAMELLVEHGVQATPMSAIAKAANVGMGTIYNYFPTKEELINGIYMYIKQDEIKAIHQPFVSEAIKHQFEQFFGALATYLVHNPLHFRFMDQFHSSPVITDATRNEGNAAFATYIDLLRKGQEQGIVKAISLEELMQFVNGGLMAFVRGVIIHNKLLTPVMLQNQLQIAWDAIKQ